MFGLFIGYGYMAPLKNCYQHLPTRKGLCSGTALMGFGLGAFFFNFIVLALINPDNVKQIDHLFPRQIGQHLPPALRIMSIIYASVGLLGTFLIQQPPKSIQNESPLVPQLLDDPLAGVSNYSKKAFCLAIQKRQYVLLAIICAGVPYGIFVAFNYKQYGLIYIHDDKFVSLIGSLGSVCNGVFRMFWGFLMDYLPFSTVSVALSTISLASCISISFSVHNKYLYMISVLASYSSYGALYSIFPTQTIRIFGQKTGPKLYYLTFIGFSLGSLVQLAAHIVLVDGLGQDGYFYCFSVFGGLLIISVVIALCCKLKLHPQQADFANKKSREKQAVSLVTEDDQQS